MNILEYCLDNNLSIRSFAKQINTHETTISRIANGKRGTSQKLYDKIHKVAPQIEFKKVKNKNNGVRYIIKNPSGKLKKNYKVGDKVGYLTLLKDTGKRNKTGNKYWECECICGKKVIRATNTLYGSLKHGCIISCGCKKPSDVGTRELHNPIRIQRAREKQGIVEGTMLCNLQRKNINKNNTSGVRGVYWRKREQKWCASIEFKGKHHKKLFNTKEEAIKYRKYLENEFFKPILNKYGRNVESQ